jgi:type IV secretory pathway TraG/TraD family ATPase VirD4
MKQFFTKLGFSFFSAKNRGESHIFNPLMQGARLLFKGFSPTGLMGGFEKNKIFSSSNKGLLIDGHKHRLSLKDSFNHFALISRTGGGKTTSFVIPNILKLANEKNSMIITDISGELFEQTSGYLSSCGYKVYVLNPENLSESIGYNPLYYATDSTKIDELVQILVKSSKDNRNATMDNSEFWDNGAKSLISILIKILISTGNHKYINLANVRYLINNYGGDGEDLFHLVDNFADDKTYYEFRGFIKGNPSTVLSMVSTANVALSPLGINDNLEKLTSKHTINFDSFRKEKSVIYIKTPANKQKQYSFLQNIFYHQFFNYMMESLPKRGDLPIFCLLDEFGNLNLPEFETTITTIRKYNVSISIILQDIAQLQNKYGSENANTILYGGIASKLFYSGADLPTTEMLSKILGLKDEVKTNIDGRFYLKEQAIMSSSEIRTMKDDEALFVMTNKLPLKFQIKPYYRDFILKHLTKKAPYKISMSDDFSVEYIDLNYGENDE